MRSLVLALLVACGGKTSTPAPAPAQVAQPEYLQMFGVEELRAGCPQGRVIEIRVEENGKPTHIERMEFVSVDAETATVHATSRDEAGTILSDQTGKARWDELAMHGRFPAKSTATEDNVSITVPAGTFTTRAFHVDAGATKRTLWFSTTLPGPPVKFTTEEGGVVVMTATMLRAK